MDVDSLFSYKEIKAYLPHSARKFSIWTTYSYGRTIGSKIFNYNKDLNNITNKDLLEMDCDCSDKYSDFIYTSHGHVHTGRLDIIANKALCIVMSKGAFHK